MIDVLNSELLKLRSVRSTAYLLLALALVLAGAALIVHLMTAEWDASPPEVRARFEGADPGLVVVPFARFCLGVLGALAVTSEYGSGMIRTALVSVPRRLGYLLAKTAVVAGVSLVVGAATTLAAYQVGELITGDRPAPISAFATFGEAVPVLLADTASLVLLGLLGVGFGFLLRSTAGTLVTLCVLLFVLPVTTLLLPAPWDERVYSVMLPVLAPQLAGDLRDPLLSPPAAGLVMVAYLVVVLGSGAVALLRRDA